MSDLRPAISSTLAGSTVLALLVMGVGVTAGIITGQGLEVPDLYPAGPLPEIARLSPGGIVLLGLLLLMLTPAAQVVAAAQSFARRGEYGYLTISLLVVAVLLIGLAVGVGTGPRGH